jgi:hypothetical protein
MVEKEANISGTQYIRSRVYPTSVASREAVWLRTLLARIFDLELEPTLIHCDNQSCVKLTENLVFLDRSKHIEIKYHYI